MASSSPIRTSSHMKDGDVGRGVAAVRLPILDLRQPLPQRVRGPGLMPDPEHPEAISSEPPSFTCVPTSGKLASTPRVNLKWKEEQSPIVTKRVATRGTRGRNDPRNKGMKRARERERRGYELERRLKPQRMSQQEQVRVDPRSSTTGEGTPALRGRGQSKFVLSSAEGSADDSHHLPRQLSFTQHHAFISPTQRRTPANGKAITIHGPPSSTGRRSNIFRRPPPQPARATMQQIPSGPVMRRPPPQAAPQPARATMQQIPSGPVMRRPDDWTHWLELSVKLTGLPPTVTTRDIWRCLSREGSILTIELYEDNRGNREGRGRVRFSPAPAKPFWQAGPYPLQLSGSAGTTSIRLELEHPKRTFLHPSPAKDQFKYPEIMAMHPESVDFGFMYDAKTMMAMCRVAPTPLLPVTFRLNMLRREIEVQFPLHIQDERMQTPAAGTPPHSSATMGKYNRTETYRFRIPFAQLQTVHETQTEEGHNVLVIAMDNPPNFYRKVNELNTHEDDATYWNVNDSWYRQTDIVYAPSRLRSATLTLKKTRPVIDIGRWITYRFVFDMTKNVNSTYALICKALRDYNVGVLRFPDFRVVTDREPAVWEYIDKPIIRQTGTGNLLDELIVDSVPLLPFPVRYQLEVCISQGCLNEHNLTRDFVNKLMAMDEINARDILEYVANQKSRFYDPMEILDIKIIKGTASRLKIPHYCAYTRSATITPSTVYYNTPTIETTNRVVRQYSEYADRFLRVRFTDEKFQGRINSTETETNNEIFTRVKRVMANGITIGDRHFEFLAFGNSQFREHGAYFFAPLPHLSAEGIRRWMGSFREIKVVAKHAARLGQCFSTTRAIHGIKVSLVEITDINRNGYCFTDGVGKISRFLAQLAASELGVINQTGEPPSVFQFRMGGCKGVLAVWPDAKMREIHIRPSQYKFPASHEGLEIIRWSRFTTASLNRQLILVLSALGVPDDVFVVKLKEQLSNLEQAMVDEKMALGLLQRQIDPNQMTLTLASMVLAGFQKTKEPFMASLLQLWRAWSIKYLKEKAKILIEEGAFLLGCVDESGTLKGHFNGVKTPSPEAPIEERINALPEIFVQLSKGPNGRPKVIKGPILLGRNPSLHPGDLRVVLGVDVPALHHLMDVVVMPQTGDRDISSMCSGGDLDGDDYLVMWDKDLLPHEWNHKAMDYTPPQPIELDRDVTTNDITSFFVMYMKNDTLPRIANTHQALADYMEEGVKDQKCLRLAALHSTAVDYVKTGQPARMPSELRCRKWPHFMEKDHKPKEQIYVSKKVLGQLYDQVERVDFVPAFDYPFDARILNAYRLEAKTIEDAAELKKQYDAAMRRIMAQHDIATEFEVWATFVLHHANQSKDYKFHEEMGEISGALKDCFRTACYEKAGSKDFEVMGPFVAAMYKVTQEEMAQAVEECNQTKMVGGQERRVRTMTTKTMPLMSFPWLFHSILGKIANGELLQGTGETVDATAVIQGEPKKMTPKRNRIELGIMDADDTLLTAEGVIHRGEALELFHHGGETSGTQKNVSTTFDMLDDLDTAAPSKAAKSVHNESRVLENPATNETQAVDSNSDRLIDFGADNVVVAGNEALIDFGMDAEETIYPLPSLKLTPSPLSMLAGLDFGGEQLIDVPWPSQATATVSTASHTSPSVDDLLGGVNDMELSSTSADIYPMSISSDTAALDTPQEDEAVLTPSSHSAVASKVEIASGPSPVQTRPSQIGIVSNPLGSPAEELIHIYPDDSRSMEHITHQTANLDLLEGIENLDEWISKQGDVIEEEVVKDAASVDESGSDGEAEIEVRLDIKPSPLRLLAEMVGNDI